MPKRLHGYLLNLRLFVPVNTRDLHDATTKGKAIINAMEWGDLTGIRAAKVLKASQRFTSMAADQPPGESGEEATAEITEVGEDYVDVHVQGQMPAGVAGNPAAVAEWVARSALAQDADAANDPEFEEVSQTETIASPQEWRDAIDNAEEFKERPRQSRPREHA